MGSVRKVIECRKKVVCKIHKVLGSVCCVCFMLLRLICTVVSCITILTLSKFGYNELQYLKNNFNESR